MVIIGITTSPLEFVQQTRCSKNEWMKHLMKHSAGSPHNHRRHISGWSLKVGSRSWKRNQVHPDKVQVCLTDYYSLLDVWWLAPRSQESESCSKYVCTNFQEKAGVYTWNVRLPLAITSRKTAIVRDLLKKENEWCWGSEHDQAFHEIKIMVTWSSAAVQRSWLTNHDSSWCL